MTTENVRMAGRFRTSLFLLVSAAACYAVAAQPALVRSIPTDTFKSTVVRPDGSALAVNREGVIRRDAAGSQRYLARVRGNQNVTLTRKSGVFGVTTFADNAPSTLHASAFDLYDESGKRLFRLEKPQATEFMISDDGRWILGIAGGDEMRESKLHLFDAKGAPVTSWLVPYLSDLTMPAGATRFFAASKGVLQAYSYAGGDPHAIGRFETFGTGGQGRYVVLCGAGSVAMYQDEKLVFTAPTELETPRVAAVSSDGFHVVVAGQDRLELFECSKGEKIWTVTSGRPELQFISVDLSGGPDAILAGLDFDPGALSDALRHTSGAVFLLGQSGELRWRDDFKYSAWNVRVPAVRYLGPGGQIEVELAKEIRCYSLP